MRRWIARHPFLAFYLVAIALPALLFIYLTVIEGLARMGGGAEASVFMRFVQTRERLHVEWPLLTQHQDGLPKMLFLYFMVPLASPFLFFPFAPTISALIVTRLNQGTLAVRALVSLLRPVCGPVAQGEAIQTYALLLAALVVIVVAPWLYLDLLGEAGAATHFARGLGLNHPASFAMGWGVALFMNQGGLLEELGWRGYAWPWLVRYFGDPFKAALLLGVAWAMWHSPRDVWMWATGQQTLGMILEWLVIFVPACVGMTLMAVYFVNRTGGSVLPAIMIHGCLNYLAQGFSSGNTGVRSTVPAEWSVVWVAAGLVTLAIAGRDLAWSRRAAIHGPARATDPARHWCPDDSGQNGKQEGRHA